VRKSIEFLVPIHLWGELSPGELTSDDKFRRLNG
jgi:hypothetical protein